MKSDGLISLTEFLGWGIVGTAAFLLVMKMASGKINLRGLCNNDVDGGLSPARVQLLFTTLIGAFGYLGIVFDTLVKGGIGSPPSLPDLPPAVLAALGGTNVFYLGAKALITGGWLEQLRGGQ